MINITTFNCHSIRKNIEKVIELLKCNDIVLLQELMLYLEDAEFIKNVDPDFECCFMLNKLDDNMILGGRPSRGVAILWRKCLNNSISPLKIDDRLIGIYMSSINKGKILILNVYMPYDAHDSESLHEYRTYIAKLQSLIDCNDFDNIIIAGDLNADPAKGRFWKEIKYFLTLNNIYHMSSELNNNDFTYLCPATSSTSFLDHILCNQNLKDNIIDLKIQYEFSLFDHFPVSFSLDIQLDHLTSFTNNKENNSYIDWNKIRKDEIKDYQHNIDQLITNNKISIDKFTGCYRENCTDKSCKESLDGFLDFIIYVLLMSARRLVKTSRKKYQQTAG